MAINPNTDFSVSSVLTAAQQNRFPRGVVAYTAITTSDSTITTEEVQITSSSFTAVANRYYRITYHEPYLSGNTATQVFTLRIRQTNISGTMILSNTVINTVGNIFYGTFGLLVGYTTFTAGSTVLVATLQCSTGTGNASGATGQVRYLSVEDVGPA